MIVQKLDSRLIVSSGCKVFGVDVETGEAQLVELPPPRLPQNLTRSQQQLLEKEERLINGISVSRDGQHIAISNEIKQIVVYDRSFKVLKNFQINRTASQITFASGGNLIVADRTGDVFLYDFEGEKSEGTLLLGHNSMILDLVFSECGKYVVTCDRDEKIRVSHFPNTYSIVSYCLGHEEFVKVITIVNQVLVSASGDGTVRFWNYLKGEQLGVINTNENITEHDVLREFSEEMNKEKVDVTALPISDMQVTLKDDRLLVAVTLFRHQGVLLYETDSVYKSLHLATIHVPNSAFKFLLCNRLLIFHCGVAVYEIGDGKYFKCSLPKLEEFFFSQQNIFKYNDKDSLSVLYKRKFDNVHEYLERKKQRLESSK